MQKYKNIMSMSNNRMPKYNDRISKFNDSMLGVTITSNLRWNTHVSNVCTKANRTLGFLRRNLYSCPQEVNEAAYKGLVRPVLDYGSSVWDPQV